MTDLEKAIAEVNHITGNGAGWDAWDFWAGGEHHDEPTAFNHAEATILNAVVSGDLLPATERDAAVASALEDAVDRFPDGRQPWPPRAIRKAILALITQPQADALARVRAEAVVDAMTELKDAVQAIRMQAGGAADGVRFHVRQMIRKRISAAQADYEARIRAGTEGGE